MSFSNAIADESFAGLSVLSVGMLVDLLNQDELDDHALLRTLANDIEGTVASAQADRPLAGSLSTERLVVIPANLPDLLEALVFDRGNPAHQLDDDMPRDAT
jgi:hypothetical protein